MENNHTFLYFAYGSNLLKERLQLKNPSATVHCVAKLKVQCDVSSMYCITRHAKLNTLTLFLPRTINWCLGTIKALPVTGGMEVWPP